MADNFLEKQYADYQARKSAMQSGAQRKTRQAMWHVAEIAVYSADDEAMRQFYIDLFGGESHERGVQFDNGLLLRFEPHGTAQTITLRMDSRYQYEQLLKRLATKGIPTSDNTITDPTGNRLQII